MSKVTSKLQLTIPKAIADQYAIEPGDEVEWVAADGAVRVVPAKALPKKRDAAFCLHLFDAATSRQRERERANPVAPSASRGWTRDELYQRGSSS
jgi:AbrB family looped-hinge helix DNA binding protein